MTHPRQLHLWFLLLLFTSADTASAGCGAATFQPISPFVPTGTTHNAYFLTDPSAQQRAVFDLVWGGALASLKLNNTEMVWGNGAGGMVQPAWHYYPGSSTAPDYNPTQAGDNSGLGSTVVGVRCIDSNTLYIMTGGVLDFRRGAGGYVVANAVKNNGAVGTSYATPYSVVTIASFVPNPGGTPAYYLKLQQTIANLDPSEEFPWGFELAGYTPYTFTNSAQYPASCSQPAPCPPASTPQLVGGRYPNATLTNGTAFYISPQTYWAGSVSAFPTFKTDSINQNQSVHLFNAFWSLGPRTSRTFVWYVMTGNWSAALSFAQSH